MVQREQALEGNGFDAADGLSAQALARSDNPERKTAAFLCRIAKRACSVAVRVAAGCALLMGIAAVYGYYAFGSPGIAIAYLKGNVLTIAPQRMDLGTIKANSREQVYFVVRNLSNRDINIIGGASTCTCVATTALPTTLGPGESRQLEVVARFGSAPGGFSQTVTFFPDAPAQPELRAQLVCDIVQ